MNSLHRIYVIIPSSTAPVMTTTELTRCAFIVLAVRITGSEGDTTGTLQVEKQ
jgi:hypothetical protein